MAAARYIITCNYCPLKLSPGPCLLRCPGPYHWPADSPVGVTANGNKASARPDWQPVWQNRYLRSCSFRGSPRQPQPRPARVPHLSGAWPSGLSTAILTPWFPLASLQPLCLCFPLHDTASCFLPPSPCAGLVPLLCTYKGSIAILDTRLLKIREVRCLS